MRRPVVLSALLFVAPLALAAPAMAQSYGYTGQDYSPGYDRDHDRAYSRDYGHEYSPYGREYRQSYSHGRTGRGYVPTQFDWRSQLDRPGDYRCDAFWDASRTDCAAPWRDQRRSYGYGWRTDYGQDARYSGYGQTDPYYSRPTSYGGSQYGYSSRRRGYGHAPRAQVGGEAWYGAYGRPDLVYSHDVNRPGRDPRRVAWCRASYRSYDATSGYYRAYSGRLVYCG